MRFWKTILNCFFKNSKIDKVGHRTSGKISAKCSFGCVICSLENAVKKTLPKSEGFRSKSEKDKKNSLRKALFASKNHFCVSRMQNWQACQDYKTFFTKWPSGVIECSFDKRPIFSPKFWKWQNGWSNFKRKFQKLFLWTANMPLW